MSTIDLDTQPVEVRERRNPAVTMLAATLTAIVAIIAIIATTTAQHPPATPTPKPVTHVVAFHATSLNAAASIVTDGTTSPAPIGPPVIATNPTAAILAATADGVRAECDITIDGVMVDMEDARNPGDTVICAWLPNIGGRR